MAERILLRTDTALNWSTINPVLGSGELGFELDTNKLKVGDGTTAWNTLEYLVAETDLSDYLTIASASTTYLTQSNASSTYLTQSSASSTYAKSLIENTTADPSGYLILSNKDKLILAGSGSPTTLYVPYNSSVPFPVGTQISICQINSGQVTIAPAPDTTVFINSPSGLKLRAQYSTATLIKVSTDGWLAMGDLIT